MIFFNASCRPLNGYGSVRCKIVSINLLLYDHLIITRNSLITSLLAKCVAPPTRFTRVIDRDPCSWSQLLLCKFKLVESVPWQHQKASQFVSINEKSPSSPTPAMPTLSSSWPNYEKTKPTKAIQILSNKKILIPITKNLRCAQYMRRAIQKQL